MGNRDLLNIERALNGIDRKLGGIERNLQVPRVTISSPTTQSGHLEAQVPVEIDWTPAAIKTEAQFIVRPDGRVTIVIEVVGEDADILMQSLPEVPVEQLQLSAIAR